MVFDRCSINDYLLIAYLIDGTDRSEIPNCQFEMCPAKLNDNQVPEANILRLV